MKALLVSILAAASLVAAPEAVVAAKKPAHRPAHHAKSTAQPAAFIRPVQDVGRYRNNRTSPVRYRVGPYRPPLGWFNHQWAFGERLPKLFIISPYWVPNYGRFGLVEPPSGFVWVRVSSDAMLVEMDSGLILQAVYSVFY